MVVPYTQKISYPVGEKEPSCTKQIHIKIYSKAPVDNMRYITYVLLKVISRTVLFWVITQRVVVNPYRRFGTNYLAPSSMPLEGVTNE